MVVPEAVLPAGVLGAVLGILLLIPVFALGHCDTMNGPVVADARKALAAADVTGVLKWVKPEAEPEIRAAFKQAVAVRTKGKDAQALADRSFFETLVRVHRAGEGAPYTGLKDEPVEPIIAKTDAALAGGSVDEVVKLLQEALAESVRHRFERAEAAAKEQDKDVASGREYVEAYVEFTHYMERLHSAIEAAGGAEHHE
jgi:hypothetical protein